MAAPKRVDPLKAKAAKQKKIAIGGFVLLIALVAFQGPKTLKLLKGPQPITPAAATTPTTTTGTPAPATAAGAPPAGAPVTGETPATPAADLASVPDSDQAPVVDAGQLATFELFSSKDPFAQQAEPVTAKPAPAKPDKPEPAKPPVETAKPVETDGAGTDAGTDGGFTTGGTPPAAPVLASSNSIAVNGVAEDVEVAAEFPSAQPTFVLVSVATDGKSAQIGIAGGQYADGGETLKLTLGKKITLQNTADGSRFELELLSLKGFPLPKQKG